MTRSSTLSDAPCTSKGVPSTPGMITPNLPLECSHRPVNSNRHLVGTEVAQRVHTTGAWFHYLCFFAPRRVKTSCMCPRSGDRPDGVKDREVTPPAGAVGRIIANEGAGINRYSSRRNPRDWCSKSRGIVTAYPPDALPTVEQEDRQILLLIWCFIGSPNSGCVIG